MTTKIETPATEHTEETTVQVELNNETVEQKPTEEAVAKKASKKGKAVKAAKRSSEGDQLNVPKPEVEVLSDIGRQFRLVIPAEVVDKAAFQTYREISKKRRFDGFRLGKTPVQIVAKQFGEQVREEKLQDVLPPYLQAAFKQIDEVAPFQPTVHPEKNLQGQDVELLITYEVLPRFTVAPLKDLKVEQVTSEINEDDVTEMVENVRRQQLTWEESDQAIPEKDAKVSVDFTAYEGDEVAGDKIIAREITIGEEAIVAGFDAQLIGQKKGATLSFELDVAEDDKNSAWKGKTIRYEVAILDVHVASLPELDEAFFTECGTENLEELKDELRKNMQRELNQRVQNFNTEHVMKALNSANEISVPQGMIQMEVRKMKVNLMRHFGAAEKDLAALEVSHQDMELFGHKAQQSAKGNLLLRQVIEEGKIEADQAAIDSRLQEIASAYEDPQEFLQHVEGNSQALEPIQNIVLEQKVVAHIFAAAQTTEKAMSFSEIMQKKSMQMGPF